MMRQLKWVSSVGVSPMWGKFRLGDEGGKLVTLVLLIVTLIPVAVLYMGAYERATSRLFARHLNVSFGELRDAAPGDLIAVSGKIAADSVVLPSDRPHFTGAMWVRERIEVWRWFDDPYSSWRTRQVATWASENATIAGWKIDSGLLTTARFPWYRASPCSDYTPAEGWIADCESGYAYKSNDSKVRLSYDVGPIPDKVYWLVAEVSRTPGTLTAIHNEILPGGLESSILSSTPFEPRQVWAAQMEGFLAQMHAGLAGQLLVSWAYMTAAVRSARKCALSAALLPATWRALLMTAPFLAMYADFESGVLHSAFIFAIAASFGAALFLWWRVVDTADAKLSQRSRTIVR